MACMLWESGLMAPHSVLCTLSLDRHQLGISAELPVVTLKAKRSCRLFAHFITRAKD